MYLASQSAALVLTGLPVSIAIKWWEFSPELRDKIWDWPGNETILSSFYGIMLLL